MLKDMSIVGTLVHVECYQQWRGGFFCHFTELNNVNDIKNQPKTGEIIQIFEINCERK
jgi:hypothetical protein